MRPGWPGCCARGSSVPGRCCGPTWTGSTRSTRRSTRSSPSPRTSPSRARANWIELAARGEFAGPLHGLPMAHKDNHLTAGIRTTFGSRLRADLVPDTDDLVIERLRAAGVVTIGKTNIPEFAAGGHTFNEVFGITRNPYDLSVTAGGSSGGAAAALAAGLHPLADGNDMGGSLRLPAGFCNVVGLRPTAGRVPVYPAPDGFAGLSVRARWPAPSTTSPCCCPCSPGPTGARRSPWRNPGRVRFDARGRRWPGPGSRSPRTWAARCGSRPRWRRWCGRRPRPARRTAPGVEEASPDFAGADECFRVLRAWQFEATLGGELDARADLVRPSLLANMLEGRTLTGPQVGRAAVLRTALFHRMREFLDEFDALLLPVAPLPAFAAEVQYPDVVAGVPQPDYLGWMRPVCHVTVTGHPGDRRCPAGSARRARRSACRSSAGTAASASCWPSRGFEAVTGYSARRPRLG